MNKSEFIDLVAERAQMTKKAAADAVDAIFDSTSGAIAHAMGSHGKLSIPGFGRFSTRKRAARKGRNPRTGAEVDIPERTTLAFTPGKGMKEALAETGTPTAGSKTAGGTKKAGGTGARAAGKTAGAKGGPKTAAKTGGRTKATAGGTTRTKK